MVLVLDGGSTSVLDYVSETEKTDLMSSPLWTSQALFSCPAAVEKLYEAYVNAGAQLISCMTYQQSNLTMKHVKDNPEAYDLGMRTALQSCGTSGGKVSAVLTLGTHAAMLANGAEYSHVYHDEDRATLKDFHTERLSKFSSMPSWAQVQYMAFETLPDVLEAEIILDVLDELKDKLSLSVKRTWISFSCSGEGAINKVLAGVQRLLKHNKIDLLWGVGINCFKENMAGVVAPFCDLLAEKQLYAVIYRDAGPQWDPVRRVFVGETMSPLAWAERAAADAKYNGGSVVIGGCCQTTPQHIAALQACLCSQT
ncbi:protein of unknown function [Taphrina deformans PYCC 5710]|uniref:Hcy-binding domain-containing protein n=1 Tax=Taphrina deformans (strain PYCC 5710 / ATCC 11124 / CBS 356.35 / IMI 108563 / JCM 9778 / NBRC 8474) TaxID=1097556 RepID=R4XKL0_TAPDE|nr:protein of unknown function [Taphrina deformans PYCC 5710]|eukprot:CCG83854.1 protein of unknown function [Taphrina deformans PYCC 5710]